MASAAEHEDGPGGGLPGAPAGIPVDLTLVKQEAEDWWEVGGGPWPEPAAEDGRAGAARPKPEVAGGWRVKAEQVEVKVENVKVEEETADWPEVKEEQEEQEEEEEEEPGWQLKHELDVGRSAKEEPGVDAAPVEREHWLRTDLKDDVRVKDEPAATPAVGCKRKLAMSRCETCGTKEAKYRCPRCMRYSCSLPCVKKHKAELTCNGVRDKTAYISIQHFTEMNLLSDYRFLEDVARTADHISRDTFLKRPTSSKRMCFMKNRARRQGINLRLLPNGFTKRKENSTFFDKRKQQFCWHVKLQFPQSQAEYIEKRVPEDKTINEILKSYIDPEKSDPVIRQRLKAYIRSQTGVQILMKVENMQQNLLRYHELDPYQSLLDNLRNKVIIEYPTLLIVLKGSSNNLKILHQVKSESATHLDNEN